MRVIKKYLSLLCFFMQSVAFANDPISWQGLYIGLVGGGALTEFNAKTATQSGTLLDALQANAVNQAGNQTLRPHGFLAGGLIGYNWQIKQFLLGLESDIQSLSINDTINSGAVFYPNSPSPQFVITSYAAQNWLMTARPRIGFITNEGLFYLTGGLAVTWLQSDFLFTLNSGGFESQQVKQFQPGYTLGGGFETALTNHISMKIEYLFNYFGRINAYKMNQAIPSSQPFKNSVNLSENMLRLGLNYHFNHLSPQLIPQRLTIDQWQIEAGIRPAYSTGTNGSPQPLLFNPGDVLVSRLTFKDLTATTLEAYFRADLNNGLFTKGLLGAGTISQAQLHDEDFPGFAAYSNTLSKGNGNLSFAIADMGYSFFNNSYAKTGMFIGYQYFAQNMSVYGCEQLAGDIVCVPSQPLNQFLALSEEDNYQSARIGIVSQFDITDRIQLTSEAAYLPVVRYRGQDNHNARQLIGPEASNSGNGSMLESVLSYQLSNAWNIGVGARYWMWNMRNGNVIFDFLGDPSSFSQPARYNTYRYGAFLQLTYHEKPIHSFSYFTLLPTWQGFYLGGNVGGAWGNTHWSDPFNSTSADAGFTNVAGFGDDIHSTGPLGSIDAHYYWQIKRAILGLGANIAITDIRGENTLFSGLGGVNGESYTNYLMTLVGKIGFTNGPSLFYLNVGPAFLNTKYRINANTGALSYGAQYRSIFQSGATLGVGIDYALSDHWTTNVEYDYIHIANKSISFPEIAIINNEHYTLRQNLNIFKVGLNYRFE